MSATPELKVGANGKDVYKRQRLIFRDYILQLTEANCTLAANCLRTWIFVQNVDVNYPGVVKARKEVFATQNLTEETHFIASTGIEGRLSLIHISALNTKRSKPTDVLISALPIN